MRDYSFLEHIEDDDVKREALRELCKTDLYFLCRYVLNYTKMEQKTDIHYRLCDEMDNDPYRFLVLVFRNAFKTSIAIGKVIQWILRDPSCQIGVGSDVKERAVDRVRDIRNILAENSKLKELFPDILYANPENESSLWRVDEFDVKKPSRDKMMGGFRLATVTAFGLDPLPTGAHFTQVLFDDVENDYNQANDAQIEKLNKNLSLFTPIPQPDCPIIMLGTIYSKHGPNTKFQKLWKTYRCPIVDKYGEPTFPSLYGKDQIERIRRECADEWTWNGQYMLQASDRTDKFLYPFRGKTFTYVSVRNGVIFRNKHEIPLDECHIIITVDPGGGADAQSGRQNKKLDKVGVCVNAVDVTGRWTFLELYKVYLNDDQFLDHLFDLNEKWNPYIIGIEKMPHLDMLIRKEMKIRRIGLKIAELKPARRNKADRIRALLPLLNTIDFSDSLFGSESSLQGWYTEQEHDDDDWDAAAYQIDIATAPTRDIIKRKRFTEDSREAKERFATLSVGEQAEWKHWAEVEKNIQHVEEMDFNDDLEDFYSESY